MKRAAAALFGKPIYFNDVHIEDREKFKKLVDNMSGLICND